MLGIGRFSRRLRRYSGFSRCLRGYGRFSRRLRRYGGFGRRLRRCSSLLHSRRLLCMLVYMPLQVVLVSMAEAGMAMAMPAMGITYMMLAMALCMRIFLMFVRSSLRGFSGLHARCLGSGIQFLGSVRLFSGLHARCWGSGIQFLDSVRLFSGIDFLCGILCRIRLDLRGDFGTIAGLGLSIGLDGSGDFLFGGKSVAGDIVQRY